MGTVIPIRPSDPSRTDESAPLAPETRMWFGSGAPGIERLDATLRGEAFATHRHDTYAVGITLRGVQTFRYRGEQRHCLPGEWHVLHPDEPHDGAPGTDDGFRYRILHVDPMLIQAALGGRPLPFVPDPVVTDDGGCSPLGDHLTDLGAPLDDLAATEIAADITGLLARHADTPRAASARIDLAAMLRVRSVLLDTPEARHRVEDLETVAGLDRWAIARQFRAAFGTSPTRFRTMRRIERARRLMRSGHPLSEVAVRAGFADQSHLTRMFKRTHGLTPGAWVKGVRSEPPPLLTPPS